MARITLNTKKSLFKPIEIELDGQVYVVDRITPAKLEEVTAFEDDARRGDLSALVKQFSSLTGTPVKKLNQVDVRDLAEALKQLTALIFKPERAEGESEAEKNAESPAEKQSPK